MRRATIMCLGSLLWALSGCNTWQETEQAMRQGGMGNDGAITDFQNGFAAGFVQCGQEYHTQLQGGLDAIQTALDHILRLANDPNATEKIDEFLNAVSANGIAELDIFVELVVRTKNQAVKRIENSRKSLHLEPLAAGKALADAVVEFHESVTREADTVHLILQDIAAESEKYRKVLVEGGLMNEYRSFVAGFRQLAAEAEVGFDNAYGMLAMGLFEEFVPAELAGKIPEHVRMGVMFATNFLDIAGKDIDIDPKKVGFLCGYVSFELIPWTKVFAPVQFAKFGKGDQKLKVMETAGLKNGGRVVQRFIASKERATKHGWCFAEGTLVHTAKGPLPIECIKAGDLVWAKDFESGSSVLTPVFAVHESLPLHYLSIEYTTELEYLQFRLSVTDTGKQYPSLTVTGNHELYNPSISDYVRADQFAPGDAFLGLDGVRRYVVRTAHQLNTGGKQSYDLSLSEFNCYYVGQDPVLAHNHYGAAHCIRMLDLAETFLKRGIRKQGGAVKGAPVPMKDLPFIDFSAGDLKNMTEHQKLYWGIQHIFGNILARSGRPHKFEADFVRNVNKALASEQGGTLYKPYIATKRAWGSIAKPVNCDASHFLAGTLDG